MVAEPMGVLQVAGRTSRTTRGQRSRRSRHSRQLRRHRPAQLQAKKRLPEQEDEQGFLFDPYWDEVFAAYYDPTLGTCCRI
jgi:hypothetical protein